MIFVVIFILGAVIGSFLNVCIYRIPRGESIAFPPSHCTNCGKKIKWYNLFPIVSYIILQGKCADCGERISVRYPAVEALNGILWAAAFAITGQILTAGISMVLISVFIVIISIMIDNRSR